MLRFARISKVLTGNDLHSNGASYTKYNKKIHALFRSIE